MNSTSQTYMVYYDPATTRRLNTSFMRARWKDWLIWGLKTGGTFVFYAFIVWCIISYKVGEYDVDALIFASSLFLAVGLGLPLLYYIRALDKREKDHDAEEVWTCEITDGGWSCQRKNGLLNYVPWKQMKLEFEHEDGWLVNCGDRDIWVFRQPLRDAGLEETFRSRITKSAKR